MTEDDKKSMLSKISFHDNSNKLNDVDFAVEVIYFNVIIKIGR